MTNPDREELFTPNELAVRLDEWANCLDKSQWDLRSDMRCAAIHLRRLASSDSGVKVKPLVWRDHRPDSFPEPSWSAQTPFGFYNIEEVSASDSPAYVVRLHAHHFVADKDSLDAAKAAAQADYESRIKSALVEVPAVKGEPEPVAWRDIIEQSDERPLPTYGQIPWAQLGRDVNDATFGRRTDYEFSDKVYPGHQMVLGINFNSLARIVDKYRYYGLPCNGNPTTAKPADAGMREALEKHNTFIAGIYDSLPKTRIDRDKLPATRDAALTAPGATTKSDGGSFQERVRPWMLECFGAAVAADTIERNHRFLEEALELVQACGCTQSEAHQLVDYVFGRDQGDINQEVGGVMVTLAALCLANGFDMHAAGETELARIWTKVEAIRAKQAAKPKHSPLPGPSDPSPTRSDVTVEELARFLDPRAFDEGAEPNTQIRRRQFIIEKARALFNQFEIRRK